MKRDLYAYDACMSTPAAARNWEIAWHKVGIVLLKQFEVDVKDEDEPAENVHPKATVVEQQEKEKHEPKADEPVCAEKCQADFIAKLNKEKQCRGELKKSFGACMKKMKKGKNAKPRITCETKQRRGMINILPLSYIETNECKTDRT